MRVAVVGAGYWGPVSSGISSRLGRSPRCATWTRGGWPKCESATFNLRPDAVEQAITGRTKAIIPVHLYGQPADLGPLVALARERRIAIVEDCAQSIGSTWSPAAGGAPRKTGTLGTIGCFSFFPTKDLGAAGDGGMCATDDPALAERACREALSLPMFPELTEPEQDFVVETLKQAVALPAGVLR